MDLERVLVMILENVLTDKKRKEITPLHCHLHVIMFWHAFTI
jgi:hypothetical protein